MLKYASTSPKALVLQLPGKLGWCCVQESPVCPLAPVCHHAAIVHDTFLKCAMVSSWMGNKDSCKDQYNGTVICARPGEISFKYAGVYFAAQALPYSYSTTASRKEFSVV